MLPISRILVPVDFSDRCLGMMPYVKAVAEAYRAEVTLVHIVNPFYGIPPTALSGPALIHVSQGILAEKVKELEGFAVSELAGLKVERSVYEGDTVSQIVEFTRVERIGLIAMPTHGYGVLRRFLIDSVTSHVLHDVSCPVLTGVHIEERPTPRSVSFTNLLCAVDLGQQSQETLEWATRFAADVHARLGIVHVIPVMKDRAALLLSPEVEAEMRGKVQTEIGKLQTAAGAESATVYIETGEAAKTVAAVAKAAGADLLIIGRGIVLEEETGRLRTNAYAIIRQSPCPVISI